MGFVPFSIQPRGAPAPAAVFLFIVFQTASSCSAFFSTGASTIATAAPMSAVASCGHENMADIRSAIASYKQRLKTSSR